MVCISEVTLTEKTYEHFAYQSLKDWLKNKAWKAWPVPKWLQTAHYQKGVAKNVMIPNS